MTANPKNLHDSSPGAIAARRGYWEKRARDEKKRATIARREKAIRALEARAGKHAGRAAGGVAGHVRSFASHPVRYAKTGKAENKVGLAVLLFFGLIAVASLRRGAWPDASGFLSIAGATLAVVLLSAVAPDLVVAVLLVVLFIMALTNVQTILGITDLLFGRLGSSIGPVRAVAGGGGMRVL